MEVDVMVMVFGILNFIEDFFFDESWWLDFVGVVIVVIEML